MPKSFIATVFLSLILCGVCLALIIFMSQNIDKTNTITEKKLVQFEADIKTLHDKDKDVDKAIKKLDDRLGKIENLNPNIVDLLGHDNSDDVKNKPTDKDKQKEKPADKPAKETPNKPTLPIKPKNPKEEPTTPLPKDNEKPVTSAPVSQLNFRSEPSLSSGVIRTFGSNETVTILGEEKAADGYTWSKVKDSRGQIGWVAKSFLQ